MRFYVKGKDDPHGSQVALYIGNLPTSLTTLQYERILSDICSRNGEVNRKLLLLCIVLNIWRTLAPIAWALNCAWLIHSDSCLLSATPADLLAVSKAIRPLFLEEEAVCISFL